MNLRMGINLGPVRLVKDINGQYNLLGDGVNVGERVMSFAEPGQIMASRSYVDVVAHLSQEYGQLFQLTHDGPSPLVVCLALLPLAVLNTACETGPLKDITLFKPKAGAGATAGGSSASNVASLKLAVGVSNYDEGNHKNATLNLQDALDSCLPETSQQVKAHKYLAFIHCAANREKLCQEEFTMALEIDPEFELTPAESGHPIWGRVFRKVKQDVKGKKSS